MAGDGTSLRGLSANLDTTDKDFPVLSTSTEDRPTGLRAPVVTEEGNETTAPLGHVEDLLDVSWDGDKTQISQDLVDGMSNEDLWLHIRRFNKQIFHIKETTRLQPGQLDFSVAEEEEFSPNKLRAQFERLYTGVLTGLLGFVQQLARLRSWREPRRTALFCVVYFLTWALDFLVPTCLATVVAIIVSPRARGILFPPAPLALVDFKTGGVSKPPAGVLASTSSATGAPENMKGEAIENEASNFVTGIGAITMNALIDKDPQHDEDEKEGGVTAQLPEPNGLATKIATAKDKASGIDRPSQDKTKSPMEQMLWSKMRPFMHGLCIVSDTWERIKNLLDPQTPFSTDSGRLRLSSPALSLLILSTFMGCYTFYKTITFVIGLALFGGPVLMELHAWLSYRGFTINNVIFKGVPTDAQLTIALLRLAEANRAPLPSPPLPQKSPSQQPHPIDDDILNSAAGDQPLGATQEEIHEAASHNSDMLSDAGGADHEATESGSHGKRRGKFLGIFKIGAKAAAKTVVGVDSLRAKSGNQSAKNRLGAVSSYVKPAISGPIEFAARYNGDQGYIYLTTDTAFPCVCFSTKAAKDNSDGQTRQKLQDAWIVPVAEIKELNKYSGYGTKSKLLAGWALDKQVMDGLEIVDKHGDTKLVTAVPRRDELFNRLCAIGNQKWEICTTNQELNNSGGL